MIKNNIYNLIIKIKKPIKITRTLIFQCTKLVDEVNTLEKCIMIYIRNISDI